MRFRLATLLLAAALTAACGTEDKGPTGVEPEQSFGRMRFVNAVADPAIADRVNVNVDGVPFGVNLAYGGVAPSGTTLYYPAYEGNRQLLVQRTADTSVKVLDQAVSITADVYQTVFAVKSGATVGTVVITDDNSAPATDMVKLRVVHLAPSAGNVDVYVTAPGADISTIAPTFADVVPGTASGYLETAKGAYQVRLTTAGTKTVVLSATTATLASGAIRTIVALDPATAGGALVSSQLVDR